MFSYRLHEGGEWSNAIPAGTFWDASVAIAKACDARPGVTGWAIYDDKGELMARYMDVRIR